MSAPPVGTMNAPSSHRMSRMTTIVQSMAWSLYSLFGTATVGPGGRSYCC